MSKVHKNEIVGSPFSFTERFKDGETGWSDPVISENSEDNRNRSCEYCGSMHPSDVAQAIQEGALLQFADFKYGWPRKVYLMHMTGQPRTWGKFYTRHLQDATEEEKEIIEETLGISFEFTEENGGTVRWSKL